MDEEGEKLIARWTRRYEREKTAREEAEKLLEEKSYALFAVNSELEARVEERTRRIEESEARFREFFRHSRDGILITTMVGEVLEVNDGMARMLGVTVESLTGRRIIELCPKRSRPGAIRALRTLEEEGHCRVESEMLRSDGSQFPVEISASRYETSGQLFIQAIVSDISVRRASQKKLREAVADAERANQAKSLFLANMSHEIRTPLNGIIGVAELVKLTRLDSEQAELVDTIAKSGDALLDLISDILDLSKIESGRLDLESAPFSLGDCVSSATSGVMAAASKKGVELACEIDSTVPDCLVGDSVRLRQILSNLLSNAVKFTREGEVVLKIGGREKVGHAGKMDLEVRVIDDGIGISLENQGKLFKKFSQVDASTTREYGGTGLGLALCKMLAQEMGGKIWVESEVGKGSTFGVEVILGVGDVAPRKPRSGNVDLGGKTVLIVDDNETNRKIMSAQCQTLGIDPIVADGAGNAVEALEKTGSVPDVCLIDMQMPEVDGLGLAQQLGQRKGFEKVPMILVTSLGMVKEVDRGSGDWPFATQLFKPVLLRPLTDAMVGVLSEKESKQVSEGELRSTSEGERLSILVAEDNMVNRRVVAKMLGKLGYESQGVGDGAAALEAIRKAREDGRPFDVVLMDVQMPVLDGEEATKQLIEEFPDPVQRPKIIALTANALKGDRERFLAAGMDDYLSKPLRMADLVDALRGLKALS